MKDLGMIPILSAKAATGIGATVQTTDADKVILEFASASSASLTVKIQGSISDTPPTFSSAQSASNMWEYIEIIDLEDGALIDGNTGVALAGTDDFRLFEINVGAMRWINANVTARAAGNLTLKARLFVNA